MSGLFHWFVVNSCQSLQTRVCLPPSEAHRATWRRDGHARGVSDEPGHRGSRESDEDPKVRENVPMERLEDQADEYGHEEVRDDAVAEHALGEGRRHR